MGIDPNEEGLSDRCPLCFPANKTPDRLYARVSGMKKGLGWTPLFGSVPNGLWVLKQEPGCNWSSNPGGRQAFLRYSTNFSNFTLTVPVLGTVFFRTRLLNCKAFFINQLTGPTGVFYDGICCISWTNPPDGPSLLRPAEALAIDLRPGQTFAEIYPVEDDVNVYRYATKRDGTKIYIKFDYS